MNLGQNSFLTHTPISVQNGSLYSTSDYLKPKVEADDFHIHSFFLVERPDIRNPVQALLKSGATFSINLTFP